MHFLKKADRKELSLIITYLHQLLTFGINIALQTNGGFSLRPSNPQLCSLLALS
jgi:hypothetical protein